MHSFSHKSPICGHCGKVNRCLTMEPFIKKLDEVINEARNLKLKTTLHFGPHTQRNEPYYIETQGCALKRLSLAKPSKPTTALMNEIFKNFLLPNGQVNVDLIKNNLSHCPTGEDLLLIEDKNHYNLLQKAVILGDVHVVEILINHGCDVNGIKSVEVCLKQTKRKGLKPCPHDHLGALHLACFLGHLDVVQYLLEKGADPSLLMKVYTSPLTKGTENVEPDVPSNMQQPSPTCVISQCGFREAAFYAVLSAQCNVPVIKLLLQRNVSPGEGATVNNTYLLHLACRVGAYESFEYLLAQCPSSVNTRDKDGLPLLLMALNNDTRFVKLLLEQGCDPHVLHSYWEPGTNILHWLFNCVRSQNLRTPEGLSDSVKLCLKMGVDVNSQTPETLMTPLHYIVETLNFTPDVTKIGKTEYLGLFLEHLDKELIECVYTLVNHGANLHIKDYHDKTPLEALLLNKNHLLRYNLSKKSLSIGLPALSNPEVAAYGLQNTLKTIKVLIERGATAKDPCSFTVDEFLRLFLTPENHTIEMLKEDSVFEISKEILKTILSAGADPDINKYAFNMRPLLRLLDGIKRMFYAPRNPFDIEEVQRLAAFIGMLLSHGARTEPIWFSHEASCFDMLIDILECLRNQPQPAWKLKALHMMVVILFQHGASPYIKRRPLYTSKSTGQGSHSGPYPEGIFLFQYLMFGMFNLSYVNDGPWYYRLFNVLYSQIDHGELYLALGQAMTEFSERHSVQGCECGQCGQFRHLLDSVFNKPRTLKRLTRLAIYNTFKRLSWSTSVIHKSHKDDLETRIAEIPLPNEVKEYVISFED